MSRHIPIVRTACAQGPGKAVLPHEGPCRNTAEAVCLEQIPQLDQRVIIVPVAEQHHRHRQRASAPDLFPQIRQQHIGHPPGIHRRSEYHQIPLAEGKLLLPGLGPGTESIRASSPATLRTVRSVVPVPLK